MQLDNEPELVIVIVFPQKSVTLTGYASGATEVVEAVSSNATQPEPNVAQLGGNYSQ
jgi:hypothetical protein